LNFLLLFLTVQSSESLFSHRSLLSSLLTSLGLFTRIFLFDILLISRLWLQWKGNGFFHFCIIITRSICNQLSLFSRRSWGSFNFIYNLLMLSFLFSCSVLSNYPSDSWWFRCNLSSWVLSLTQNNWRKYIRHFKFTWSSSFFYR